MMRNRFLVGLMTAAVVGGVSLAVDSVTAQQPAAVQNTAAAYRAPRTPGTSAGTGRGVRLPSGRRLADRNLARQPVEEEQRSAGHGLPAVADNAAGHLGAGPEDERPQVERPRP